MNTSDLTSASVDPDGEAIAIFRKGDLKGWDYIYKKYRPIVLAIIRKKIGNDKQLCMDLTQDTFERFIQSLDRYNHVDSTSIARYISTIARNLVIDHFRYTKSRLTYSIEGAPVNIPDHCLRSDELYDYKLTYRLVLEEVDKLSERLKEPLVLILVSQLKYKEVATELDLPINTVKTRISRAKQILQQRLVRQGIEGVAR